MTLSTRSALQAAADLIRGETGKGANTAARVGGTIRDLADSIAIQDANENALFAARNALLEPSAFEVFQYDAFTYASGSPRYVLASFATSLNGTTGRMEVRDPACPLLIDGATTLNGLQSGASAIVLNPAAAPVYSDYRAEYNRKQALLQTLPLKFLPLPTQNTVYPFIAGPYGTLVIQVLTFDITWIAGLNFRGDIGFNFGNELGDLAADYKRQQNAMQLILAKSQIGSLQTGVERTAGAGNGGIAYYLLPNNWSAAADPLSSSYVFRDDFMSGSLGNWTLTQSTPGNIAVNAKFAAVAGTGTGVWGTNGMISTATYARSSGLRFVADVWVPSSIPGQTIFGLTDGLGVSYTNFSHGFSLSDSGMATFEGGAFSSLGGNSRSTNFRVRITPGLTKGALYELQGGNSNPVIGSASWTTMSDTRGTSSVTAATYKIGFTPYATGVSSYISDVRVY